MEAPHTKRMENAIHNWMKNLDNYPGWEDWKREQFGRTIWYNSPTQKSSIVPDEFEFSPEMESQHSLCYLFLALQEAVISLREVEYYFRRYPFKNLPVTRYSHLTNVCEMYFNRFYEFKSRLKKYFNALKAVAPDHGLDIGKFIKQYDAVFDQELRERNSINHHRRFDDLAIDHLAVTHMMGIERADLGWDKEHLFSYRKITKQWVERVRARSLVLDKFVEAIAEATLKTCDFLEQNSEYKARENLN
ncbi:hypothetical protein Q1W73_02345 [Asticcacaulis sp. ZE23SCel15]|uniref:hypothetical protein n=1 Tax=Asticcacaulis sp. ZE23SCel15 TaxID=3059027 RepID=UPI0026601167|nr:hypothetical protein [Asticcacaulis sp. ZE23SCel15]WKL57842.1 hypothetical protein Q1W73_02345 [Asticcacaulis sp. ZE23SCel15]